MGKKILFRAIVEVLGKPKEHVDSTLKGYLQKLKENSHYQIVNEELAELKQHEDSELWMAFAEIENEVTFVGLGDRVEIWSSEKWRELEKGSETKAKQALEEIAEE